MKKIATLSVLVLGVCIAFVSCDSKRQPGKIYMPDMAYSRAYETYAARDTSVFTLDQSGFGDKIFYNNMPVSGTIKRDEMLPYLLPNDTVGYKNSAAVKNPYDSTKMTDAEMAEAGRLFNINCAVCHGEKAAGNGPLSTSGKIGGVANLTLDNYVKMADGTMFHSITYGKNNMGSYASQLSRNQRWMIIKYVRTLQPKPAVSANGNTNDSIKVKGIK
jgi:mono/diheme cytochrome c family protein